MPSPHGSGALGVKDRWSQSEPDLSRFIVQPRKTNREHSIAKTSVQRRGRRETQPSSGRATPNVRSWQHPPFGMLPGPTASSHFSPFPPSLVEALGAHEWVFEIGERETTTECRVVGLCSCPIDDVPALLADCAQRSRFESACSPHPAQSRSHKEPTTHPRQSAFTLAAAV